MNDHQSGLPAGQVPVLRIPAMPAHTNEGGDIFGGWIMGQVDIAGSIPAVLRAQGRVVTVAVEKMTFLRPVYVGDLLSIYADVVASGRTSVTVDVRVYAQRNPVAPECALVSEARLVYVAVDGDGRKRELPATGD
ncbi:MAG: acyl-CoA thioesterase [Pseudomonadota bacterium]|nr:acyl-CoA thioesterase [Pseudomonadota bacterium]